MAELKKYQKNALTTALLMDAGIALMRQNIRRRHPGKTEAEIDTMLSAWMRRADDRIPGDTAGAVCVRTRDAHDSPGGIAGSEPLEVFPDVYVPVARLHHLIALKVLARDDQTRPQDAADLRQLIASAQGFDLDRARDALCLIEERGFNRSRNLTDALTNTWREFRPPRA